MYAIRSYYVLIGIRKREEKRKKSYITFLDAQRNDSISTKSDSHVLMKVLEKNGMPPATHFNDIRLITSDQKAFRNNFV